VSTEPFEVIVYIFDAPWAIDELYVWLVL
jgi:hypothetical protein